MKLRAIAALVLAFGWLFSTPAQATPLITGDRIQFSYTWGSITQTFTDSVVTVTVTNDITNKIGYGGEVIDTYRITFANQVIEVTEKHGPRDYIFTVSGSQTITLEGIDRGFWAGYYGPVMVVAVSPIALPIESTTQSPETESPEPTQSEPVQSESASVSPASESTEVTPQPEPLPSPEPPSQPSAEPSPSQPVVTPSPEPSQPQPTQEPEPSPTPAVSLPTQSPELTPSESPTPIAPTEPASESSTPTTSPTLPTIQPEPPIPPITEPPIQSNEVISEEPPTAAPEVTQVTKETISESVSGTIETAVTETIGATIKAVGQLVEAFQSAGLDMTPEQREKAQDVVVSTVITSQVAVGMRKIK